MPGKTISRYVLVGFVYFALAFWVWTGVSPSYLRVLSVLSNACLSLLGFGDAVELRVLLFQSKWWMAVHVAAYQQKCTHLFGFTIEILQTHLPLFTALVLATRGTSFSRIRALVVGTIGLSAVALLFVLLTLCWSFVAVPEYMPYSPVHLHPATTGLVTFVYYSSHLLLIHLMPVLFWIMLCLPIKRLEELISSIRPERVRSVG